MTDTTTTTTHWHAGYNMPGYLPENEEGAYVYEEWQDARASMLEILDRHGDNSFSWVEEHDCDDIPCPTYGDSCGWQIANNLTGEMEDLNLTDASGGWDAYVGDLHYWITPCMGNECETEEEDY